MRNSYSLRQYAMKEKKEVCCKCKNKLSGEFLVKVKNNPVEKMVRKNWFSGITKLQKVDNWSLDFSTALCVDCIHDYLLQMIP